MVTTHRLSAHPAIIINRWMAGCKTLAQLNTTMAFAYKRLPGDELDIVRTTFNLKKTVLTYGERRKH